MQSRTQISHSQGKDLEITLNALFFFMQQDFNQERKRLDEQTCSWAPGLL